MKREQKPVDRVEEILQALSPMRINKVLEPHHLAREAFPLRALAVKSSLDFKLLVTAYIQHHVAFVGQGQPDEDSAFGEARRILNAAFGDDPYQEGYAVAMRMGLDGSRGGLQAVLNMVAETLARHAYGNYVDGVYFTYVDPLSKEDNVMLARAFYERFGAALNGMGVPDDPLLFAWNTRAAMEYLRQSLDMLAGNARKL